MCWNGEQYVMISVGSASASSDCINQNNVLYLRLGTELNQEASAVS